MGRHRATLEFSIDEGQDFWAINDAVFDRFDATEVRNPFDFQAATGVVKLLKPNTFQLRASIEHDDPMMASMLLCDLLLDCLVEGTWPTLYRLEHE